MLAFKALGASAKVAIPELKDLLTERQSSFFAASALATIHPEGVGVLLAQSSQPDERVRNNCANALFLLGPDAKPSLPLLLTGLKHSMPEVRTVAAGALGGIGEASSEIVSGLVSCLDDAEQGPRVKAAQSLARLGPKAKASVPALLSHAKHKDKQTADLVSHALCNVDPEVAKLAGIKDPLNAELSKDRPPDR